MVNAEVFHQRTSGQVHVVTMSRIYGQKISPEVVSLSRRAEQMLHGTTFDSHPTVWIPKSEVTHPHPPHSSPPPFGVLEECFPQRHARTPVIVNSPGRANGRGGEIGSS